MSRTINTSLLNYLYLNDDPTGDLKDIEPFYAVELLFDDTDGDQYTDAGYTGDRALRLWTGVGSRSISSETFLGTGSVLQISGLEEVADLSAKGATLTLSGLDSNIVSLAITEEYQGRLGKVYWGVKENSNVVELFSGFMDKMTIQDDGETSTITLTLESKLVTLERANISRYTDKSHKAVIVTEDYDESTDTFFKWVAKLADRQIAWGQKAD